MNNLLLHLFFLLPMIFKSKGAAMESKSNSDNYELISELKVDGNVPVFKYRSKVTGVHVVIAQVEGPLVNGYFALATEAQDDDGLPHTLEHLIFLGSENYPYKGVLDLLANRCLASGTNAWTDTDHTAYTVQTAGSVGFLNLLPIYLDHLLYPLLTDAGFITEVYHINGEAEDAGVVYSEMQAIENTASSLTYVEMLRALYPEPSGYRSETGGIMKNLRESISNAKIRKYHADYYRPENLHIIITGQVTTEEVFNALSIFENKIVSKGKRGDYTRPWESLVPKINASVDNEIMYPSDTEDTGLVRIAWRGPSAVSQVHEMLTVGVLMEYLTFSSTSPLPKVFIEVDDPLASEVYNGHIENSVSCMYLTFKGVPTSKINDIKPLLMGTLTNITNGSLDFELNIMRDVLNNLILKEKSYMETSPHDTLANYIIGDALYGYSTEDLMDRFSKKELYNNLLDKDAGFWIELMKTYFIDGYSVTMRGVPSISETQRLQKEQLDRVAARKLEVGETGLQEWSDKLEQAKLQNEIPAPSEMLKSVPVPGIDKINFHPLSAYDNLHDFENSAQNVDPSLFNFEDVPVKFQLDDLHSNFVQLIAILDTSSVNDKRRPYLPLLLSLLLESSVSIGDTVMSHEDVIQQLAADTLETSTFMGLNIKYQENFICGSYCNNAAVNLKLDMPNYKKGIEWLKRVLFNINFEAERIKVKANKLLNSIGELKRSGSKTLLLMYNDVTFAKNSNKNQVNFLRQQKFLKCTLERIEREPESVIKELKEVYDAITNSDSIIIHMAADLKALAKLGNPSIVWRKFINNNTVTSNFKLNTQSESDSRAVEQSDVTGYLTGPGSVESGFILQSTSCITQHMHWDLPALLTAIQYLTQLEGPMWKEIRGKGLAYGYRIELKPTEGTLSLYIIKAAQPGEAYSEAISILSNHINGTRPWEEDLLVSARSSLIYEVIEREAQVSDVLQQSVLAYFKRIPHTYNRDLLKRITEVSVKDVQNVAVKYFTPLIDPSQSQTIVVGPPSKMDEIKNHFNEKHGHNLQLIDDISSSRFSAW